MRLLELGAGIGNLAGLIVSGDITEDLALLGEEIKVAARARFDGLKDASALLGR